MGLYPILYWFILPIQYKHYKTRESAVTLYFFFRFSHFFLHCSWVTFPSRPIILIISLKDTHIHPLDEQQTCLNLSLLMLTYSYPWLEAFLCPVNSRSFSALNFIKLNVSSSDPDKKNVKSLYRHVLCYVSLIF